MTFMKTILICATAILSLLLGMTYLKNQEYDYFNICGTTTTSLGSHGTGVIKLSYGSAEASDKGYVLPYDVTLVAATLTTGDAVTGGDVELVPTVDGAKTTDTLKLIMNRDEAILTGASSAYISGEEVSWEIITEDANNNTGDTPTLCAIFRVMRADID